MIAWLRLVLNYWIIMKIQTFVIASHSTRWTDAVLRCYCSASSRLVYAQLDGLEKFILKIYSWPKVDCWFWGFKGLSDIQLFTSPWGAEEMWSFNETKNVCFSQSCFTCSYGLCLFVLYNCANWVTHIAITSSAVCYHSKWCSSVTSWNVTIFFLGFSSVCWTSDLYKMKYEIQTFIVLQQLSGNGSLYAFMFDLFQL